MKKFIKNITILMTWVYMLTCMVPYSPCYGVKIEEITDTDKPSSSQVKLSSTKVSSHQKTTVKEGDNTSSQSSIRKTSQKTSWGAWFASKAKSTIQCLKTAVIDVPRLFVTCRTPKILVQGGGSFIGPLWRD